jgi:hypothetical protein
MGSSHIAALLRQHEAKRTLIDSTTLVQSDTESDIGSEDVTQHPPSPQQLSPRSYDAHFLPYDPGEMIPISRYNAKDQDDVQRGYILKGPCQPCEHDFPTRKIKKKIDTSLRYGFTSTHGLNIVLQRMRPFALYVIFSKQDLIGELGVMHLLKVVIEIGKDPKHLKKHVGGVSSIHNEAQDKDMMGLAT